MSTPCPSTDTLKRYLQAELSTEEASDLEAHVTSCPACGPLLNQLADSGESLPLHLLAHDSEPNSDNSKTADFVPETERSTSAELSFDVAGYNFLEPIAEGGMGAVYRVRDLDLRRELAVKILREELRVHPTAHDRFLEEAHITGQLQHPGIVPIHELGELPDGRPFFSMKLVKGQTLAEQLAERYSPAQDLPRYIQIFQQICQTLAYAHSRGVIHRDLKPGNIMVGAFGEVQVMDWGLAKRIKDPDNTTTAVQNTKPTVGEPWDHFDPHQPHPQTEPGAVMGTWAYMPPEQARGHVDLLDERCDVFSLGAILCEILTGKPPYAGRSKEEVKRQAKAADMAPVHERLDKCECDRELIDLAKCCLFANQEERPADAGKVAEAVAAYQAAVQEKLRRAELDKARAQVRRRWVTVAAAFLLLLITGASGGALWYQQWDLTRSAAHVHLQDDMRDAVNRAQGIRAKLLAQLATYKGSQSLLNRPTVWSGQISSALQTLQRAKDLQEGAERAIDPELRKQIGEFDERLKNDEKNRQHALELEKAREEYSVIVKGRKLNTAGVLKKYRAAFRKARLDMDKDSPARLAECIRRSPIRLLLLAAVDDCAHVAWLEKQNRLRDRLLQAARRADPDPWRDRLRDPKLWGDGRAAVKLAGELLAAPPKLDQLTLQTLRLMGVLLPRGSDAQERWWRQAHQLHPDDFWFALNLGNAVNDRKKYEQAAGFYWAALAVRPGSTIAWNNLGNALRDSKDLPPAIDAYKKAVAIDPQHRMAWTNFGDALRASKDLPAAIDAHKKALAIDKQNANAWNGLGVALYDSKDLPAAIDAFEKALGIDHRFADAWCNLGSALAASNDLPAAIAAYKKAVAIDKQFATAWNNLGSNLARSNDLAAAIDAYKKALAIDKQNALAWHNLGLALYRSNNLPAAIIAYKKALAIDEDYVTAWYNLGLAFYDSNELTAAIAAFKKALAIDKQCADAWNNLGIALRTSNDLPAAIDAFKKALGIDKQHAKAWHNLGDALRATGELAAAIEAHKKALAIDNQFTNAWNGLGAALYRSKKLPAAIDAYKKALAIDKQNATAWNNLGNALADSKKWPAAIDAYKKAVAIDKQLAAPWHSLGFALADTNELPAAIDAYKKALAIDKQNATAWNNLGNALADSKKWPAAIDAYKKAVAIDKQLAAAWHNLGFALADSKDLPAAIEAYKKALAIDNQNATAWNNLGNALRDSNDLPAAIEAYKKALAIDDQDALAWYNLGIAFADGNDLTAAIDAYKKALAVNDQSAKAWYNLGVALYKSNDLSAAIDAYNNAIAINKKDAKAWTNLGIALKDKKDLRAAVDACKKAVAIDNHYAKAWTNLGIVFYDSKNLPAAIDAYKRALAIDKQDALVWSNLGGAFYDSKNVFAAIDAYKKALAIDKQYDTAWYNLGIALRDSNKLPAAIDAYKKALAIDNENAKAWAALGLALANNKEVPAAIDAYKKALAIDKQDPVAWNNFGLTLAENRNFPAAIDAYKKAIAINKENALVWNNLGLALRRNKDLAGAINAINKALAIDSENAKFWTNLGLTLRDSRKLPAAIVAFKKALDIDKDEPKAWIGLGDVHYDKKDVDAAINAYKKFLALEPHDASAWTRLGHAHNDKNDLRAAINAYQKALQIDKKYSSAWNGLGAALRAGNNLSAAIDAYKKALAINKRYPEAWTNLGLALAASNQLDAAINAHRKALAIDNQNAAICYNLALVHYKSRNMPAAIDAYKKALAIDNHDAKVWYGLGIAFHQSNDLPAAIHAYKKALAIENQLAEAHCNLGHVFKLQGKFSKAYKSLQLGHKIGSGRPNWRYPSAAWVNHCRRLLKMEERLPDVLKGEKTSSAEQLQLAGLCQRYLRRYRDAAKLYAAAFAAEPKRADDLRYGDRYNAACAAALAAAGKGKNASKIDGSEKTKLRRQALDWLRADVNAYRKLVDAKPQAAAVLVQERMLHWQKDADLAGLRDVKWSNSDLISGLGVCHAFAAIPLHHTIPSAIAAKACHPGLITAVKSYLQPLSALPKSERKQWQQLWSDVAALRKQARASYTESILKGNLTNAKLEQTHEVKLTAGKICIIDMQSKQFDTLLRITAADGKVYAENDDVIPGKNRNSRITFAPKTAGKYRLIATSNQKQGAGAYEITIREFARGKGTAIVKNPPPKKDKPKPPPPKTGPKDIAGKLTAADPLDNFPQTKKSHHKSHEIKLEVGKIYQIDLTGDFDTFLRLEDAAKKPLLANDDVTPPRGFDSRLVFAPAKSGKYRLIVTSFRPGATGKYTLKIRQLEKAGKPEIVNSQLVKSKQTIKGKFIKLHKMQLNAGTPYTIDLGSKTFDPSLLLLDPTGKAIAGNDDIAPGNKTAARIDFTPAQTGAYIVLATSDRPAATGSYTLRVQGYSAAGEKKLEK